MPPDTAIIPAVSRASWVADTRLGVILAELGDSHSWLGRRRPRPLRHVIATVGAMLCAVLAVFAVLVLRAPGMQQAPTYALLADGTGNRLGLLYAAPTEGATSGLGAWQAYASSVPVLGGGGASAPTSGTSPSPTAAPAPTAAPTSAPAAKPSTAPPTATPHPQPTATPQPPAPEVLPAPVSPWPPTSAWMRVPGHTPYAMSDYPGDPYAYAFGQCTWWAQYERRDENLRGMGNARYWATGAAARGYHVGTAPRVGATVVFQPGVQGAGWAGHVAHVLALYPDGWFLVSEMNAYGNGGGWGRVSFRYVHAGAGVQFIY